jgi:acyl carrier protein
MEQETVFEDIVNLIVSYFPDQHKENLRMDTKINTETAVDSLGFVLIISKLEAKYSIHIPDRQMNKFVTIGDVVDYIVRKAA